MVFYSLFYAGGHAGTPQYRLDEPSQMTPLDCIPTIQWLRAELRIIEYSLVPNVW
jgi:hypothetical protein